MPDPSLPSNPERTEQVTESNAYQRPIFRPRFMGRVNGQLWWDVETRRGWYVVKAGRWKHGRAKLPRVYFSPNGTPWHHAARSIFRARYVTREECVCDFCKATGRAKRVASG